MSSNHAMLINDLRRTNLAENGLRAVIISMVNWSFSDPKPGVLIHSTILQYGAIPSISIQFVAGSPSVIRSIKVFVMSFRSSVPLNHRLG